MHPNDESSCNNRAVMEPIMFQSHRRLDSKLRRSLSRDQGEEEEDEEDVPIKESSSRPMTPIFRNQSERQNSFFLQRDSFRRWIPKEWEGNGNRRYTRSFRRRLFLLLTEPDSSIASAMFYALLMGAIFAVNIIMMLQTMDSYQFYTRGLRYVWGGCTLLFRCRRRRDCQSTRLRFRCGMYLPARASPILGISSNT